MPRSSPDLAYINPSVLAWALDNSRLSRSDVASKVKVKPEKLALWEQDRQAPPPFAKAQALAKILRVPFGYFFLPDVPDDELPLPDFRSLEQSYRPTPEFLQLLNDVLVKQDWYRDYLRESKGRPSKLKFVDSFDISARVGDVAIDIRNTLSITPELRNGIGSWTEYLSTLTRHAESAGILVMRSSVVGHSTKQQVSTKEVQGFAITDSIAPVVFVNSGDFKAAQIFTFAHELAHVWIGQSAITNPDPTELGDNKIEAFCNQVATAVLVPRSEFLSAWDAGPPTLQSLARRFWVSTLVVLRRARELDRLTDAEFFDLRTEERSKMQKGKKPSGGDFYRTLFVRMGATFTYTVIGEVHRNRVSLPDGARLLGLSGRTLVKFAEMTK